MIGPGHWGWPKPWSAPQRKAVFALLAAMSVFLIIQVILFPTYVSDPQPEHPPREPDLADRIDPNTAEWQTLAALPLIGEKRAQDIVAYREQFTAQNPQGTAFSIPSDLMKIRGIGTVTMQQLEPYLLFPKQDLSAMPSTQP